MAKRKPADGIVIKNAHGTKFFVRVVKKGDKYGRDDVLTHDLAKPMVEFYDYSAVNRGLFGPRGQFVSRYDVATLLRAYNHGDLVLVLDSGIPKWRIDWPALGPFMKTLSSVQNPGLDKKWLAKDIARHARIADRAKVQELKAGVRAHRATKAEAKRASKAECAVGRVNARARAFALKLEAKEAGKKAREDAAASCVVAKGAHDAQLVGLRRTLAEEKKHQADMRRLARASRARAKEGPGVASAVRKAESDDEVRGNISPELVPLFERVQRTIKGSARMSRTEAFEKYVHEHPKEVAASADDATDAIEREMEARQRAGNPPVAWTELGRLTSLRFKDSDLKTRERRWSLEKSPYLVYDANNGKSLQIVYGALKVRDATHAEVRRYKSTHWGSEGRRAVAEGTRTLGPLRRLGESLAITYTTKKGGAELVDWVHEWGEGARGKWTAPLVFEHLCQNGRCAERGRLVLSGGTYRVTERGIVG
jgi:hypothetical protein